MNLNSLYAAGAALIALLLTSACAPLGLARSQDGPTLSTVADHPLPGDTSRFDYLSLDPTAERLYIAHLGAGSVVVYDLQAGTLVGEIDNVPGVHGVLAVPELGRVYASATDRDQVALIDPSGLAVLGTIPAGHYPDGLAFDPDLGKLYVSDETGRTDTVIDTSSNQVVATIPLGGEVGNTQYEPTLHQIFAANQTQGQVVAIDPQTDQVVAQFDTPGCEGPHGLALDPTRQLAFVGCEGNAKLAIFSLPAMTPLGLHDVGQVPDVLAIDAPAGVLYVAAENGPLTVFQETDSSTSGVQQIVQQSVGPNAHSVAVDPQTHHIYVPIANLDGKPVLRELAVSTPDQGT